jgi:hypothetical protein
MWNLGSKYNDSQAIDNYISRIISFNGADSPGSGNYALDQVVSPNYDPNFNRLEFINMGRSGLIYGVSLFDNAAVFGVRTYKLRIYNVQANDNSNASAVNATVGLASGFIAEIDLATATRTGQGGLIISQLNNPIGYQSENGNLYGLLIFQTGTLAITNTNNFQLKLDVIAK